MQILLVILPLLLGLVMGCDSDLRVSISASSCSPSDPNCNVAFDAQAFVILNQEIYSNQEKPVIEWYGGGAQRNFQLHVADNESCNSPIYVLDTQESRKQLEQLEDGAYTLLCVPRRQGRAQVFGEE